MIRAKKRSVSISRVLEYALLKATAVGEAFDNKMMEQTLSEPTAVSEAITNYNTTDVPIGPVKQLVRAVRR